MRFVENPSRFLAIDLSPKGASAACPKGGEFPESSPNTPPSESTLPDLSSQRDYKKEVEDAVERLPHPGIKIDTIAQIPFAEERSLQILKIESLAPNHAEKPWVLITGGIHGDEPAGVLAVIHFMQSEFHRYRNDFNFLVVPCVNPTGYSLGTRNNASNQNINRLFTDHSDSAEANAVLQHVRIDSRRYLMAIDCHEDNPEIPPDFSNKILLPDHSNFRPDPQPENWSQQAYAYYTYETARLDMDRVATKAIEALKTDGVEIWTKPLLYDDENVGGIVRYGPNHPNRATNGIKDLDTYIARFTGVVLTMETPTGWNIRERIRAHTTAICAALDAKRSAIELSGKN